MDINPVGTKMIHVERGTDMTKLTGTFCDYANAPTNPAPLCSSKYTSCLKNLEAEKGLPGIAFSMETPSSRSCDTIPLSLFASTYLCKVKVSKFIYITHKGPEFLLRSVHINNLRLTVVKAQSTKCFF